MCKVIYKFQNLNIRVGWVLYVKFYIINFNNTLSLIKKIYNC